MNGTAGSRGRQQVSARLGSSDPGMLATGRGCRRPFALGLREFRGFGGLGFIRLRVKDLGVYRVKG